MVDFRHDQKVDSTSLVIRKFFVQVLGALQCKAGHTLEDRAGRAGAVGPDLSLDILAVGVAVGDPRPLRASSSLFEALRIVRFFHLAGPSGFQGLCVSGVQSFVGRLVFLFGAEIDFDGGLGISAIDRLVSGGGNDEAQARNSSEQMKCREVEMRHRGELQARDLRLPCVRRSAAGPEAREPQNTEAWRMESFLCNCHLLSELPLRHRKNPGLSLHEASRSLQLSR